LKDATPLNTQEVILLVFVRGSSRSKKVAIFNLFRQLVDATIAPNRAQNGSLQGAIDANGDPLGLSAVVLCLEDGVRSEVCVAESAHHRL
jgi:hypothetical protein